MTLGVCAIVAVRGAPIWNGVGEAPGSRDCCIQYEIGRLNGDLRALNILEGIVVDSIGRIPILALAIASHEGHFASCLVYYAVALYIPIKSAAISWLPFYTKCVRVVEVIIHKLIHCANGICLERLVFASLYGFSRHGFSQVCAIEEGIERRVALHTQSFVPSVYNVVDFAVAVLVVSHWLESKWRSVAGYAWSNLC